MTKRKIILLAVCAALLAVCIIQGITGAINPVKTIKTDLRPDTITISSGSDSLVIAMKNGSWYVGNQDYLASKTDVETMIKAITEVKILDKVGRFGSALDERYDLNDEKAKTVIAVKAGKEIASLRIGKASSTGSQTYACVNGGHDIYLLSGNYISTFGKSENDLRSKTIFAIEEKNVAGAQLTAGNKTWGIQNTAKAGEKAVWALTGSTENVQLDQDACQAWIRNACFLNINSWIDDGTALPEKKLSAFQLQTTNGETILVDIYEKTIGDTTQYIGTSSVTPHKFDLTKYLTEKFTKELDSLKVKE